MKNNNLRNRYGKMGHPLVSSYSFGNFFLRFLGTFSAIPSALPAKTKHHLKGNWFARPTLIGVQSGIKRGGNDARRHI
jgi:hypothetical protein